MRVLNVQAAVVEAPEFRNLLVVLRVANVLDRQVRCHENWLPVDVLVHQFWVKGGRDLPVLYLEADLGALPELGVDLEHSPAQSLDDARRDADAQPKGLRLDRVDMLLRDLIQLLLLNAAAVVDDCDLD